MIKVLFLIHDLAHGGAEKVLVNLVNNMDSNKFEITVMSLFDVGINKQFIKPHVHYKYCFKKLFPANSHIMKLFKPKTLHDALIKDTYDIEIAYLEGPCSRIISGCSNPNTKLVSWIHIEQRTKKKVASSFRNYKEAEFCYNRFNQIVCVSESVREDFKKLVNLHIPVDVLYNTNETEQIIELSKEKVENIDFNSSSFKIIGVGKLLKSKGFDRLVKIVKRLVDEKYDVKLYILGTGPLKEELMQYISENKLNNKIVLLGYDTNPYKYMVKSNLFVCASFSEGFSTATTESLIVGTPVCTVNVGGMKEMLGENSEYGLIVENTDEALYKGIKNILQSPNLFNYYKAKAIERGKIFSREKTVSAVEKMFIRIQEE